MATRDKSIPILYTDEDDFADAESDCSESILTGPAVRRQNHELRRKRARAATSNVNGPPPRAIGWGVHESIARGDATKPIPTGEVCTGDVSVYGDKYLLEELDTPFEYNTQHSTGTGVPSPSEHSACTGAASDSVPVAKMAKLVVRDCSVPYKPVVRNTRGQYVYGNRDADAPKRSAVHEGVYTAERPWVRDNRSKIRYLDEYILGRGQMEAAYINADDPDVKHNFIRPDAIPGKPTAE